MKRIVALILVPIWILVCGLAPVDPISAVKAAFTAIDDDHHVEPQTPKARLEHLFDRDQAGRKALKAIDFSAMSADQAVGARKVAWQEIGARDLENQYELKRLLPKTGWFDRTEMGDKAMYGAFLVIQHATNDPTLMHDGLARMAPLVGTGQIDDANYALLFDRLQIQDGRPQRYGTQMKCEAGKWVLDRLEAPEKVAEYREKVGLTPSLESYVASFTSRSC